MLTGKGSIWTKCVLNKANTWAAKQVWLPLTSEIPYPGVPIITHIVWHNVQSTEAATEEHWSMHDVSEQTHAHLSQDVEFWSTDKYVTEVQICIDICSLSIMCLVSTLSYIKFWGWKESRPVTLLTQECSWCGVYKQPWSFCEDPLCTAGVKCIKNKKECMQFYICNFHPRFLSTFFSPYLTS